MKFKYCIEAQNTRLDRENDQLSFFFFAKEAESLSLLPKDTSKFSLSFSSSGNKSLTQPPVVLSGSGENGEVNYLLLYQMK